MGGDARNRAFCPAAATPLLRQSRTLNASCAFSDATLLSAHIPFVHDTLAVPHSTPFNEWGRGPCSAAHVVLQGARTVARRVVHDDGAAEGAD